MALGTVALARLPDPTMGPLFMPIQNTTYAFKENIGVPVESGQSLTISNL